MRHRRKRARSLSQLVDLSGRAALVVGALCLLGWAVLTSRGLDIPALAIAGCAVALLGIAVLIVALFVRSRRRQHDREVDHRRRASRVV